MIFMQDSNSTLEEKIYELVCEYGALETEQIRRYFDSTVGEISAEADEKRKATAGTGEGNCENLDTGNTGYAYSALLLACA